MHNSKASLLRSPTCPTPSSPGLFLTLCTSLNSPTSSVETMTRQNLYFSSSSRKVEILPKDSQLFVLLYQLSPLLTVTGSTDVIPIGRTLRSSPASLVDFDQSEPSDCHLESSELSWVSITKFKSNSYNHSSMIKPQPTTNSSK